MLKVVLEQGFAKYVKKCEKRHWDVKALKEVTEMLAYTDTTDLPLNLCDHALKGNMSGLRAVHINNAKYPKKNQWVLIYRQTEDMIYLIKTGWHKEVFNK